MEKARTESTESTHAARGVHLASFGLRTRFGGTRTPRNLPRKQGRTPDGKRSSPGSGREGKGGSSKACWAGLLSLGQQRGPRSPTRAAGREAAPGSHLLCATDGSPSPRHGLSQFNALSRRQQPTERNSSHAPPPTDSAPSQTGCQSASRTTASSGPRPVISSAPAFPGGGSPQPCFSWRK